MTTLSPQAQAIVGAFGRQPGVTRDQLANLQAALAASPALIDQINAAVAQGHLKQIVPLVNPNAGGEYDPRKQAMSLPLARLTTPPSGPYQRKLAHENASEITFVLGHELQHGFNRVATRQAYTDFAKDVEQIARKGLAPRDYTAPASALLAQNRRDEAGAEIAGWNAVASRVKSANQGASLQDIHEALPSRMRDFIDVSGTNYTLKSNLAPARDLLLDQTSANLEAMGQNYFDKPARTKGGLGPRGNSDYANYYGRSPVSFIAETERNYHPPKPGPATPQMGLNLSRLGLTEKLLEENGIDLGKNQQPLPYLDFSKQPPTPHLFQHTRTTNQHVSPTMAGDVLAAGLARQAELTGQWRNGATRDSADSDLLGKLGEGVRRLDAQGGKGWDDASDRLRAAALFMAREKGFTAEDDLQLAFNKQTARNAPGEVLHLFRQGPNASPDPAANRTQMSTLDALSRSAEERLDQLAALGTTQQQTRPGPLVPQQAPGTDDENRPGPGLRM